jgi:hypothetical protein
MLLQAVVTTACLHRMETRKKWPITNYLAMITLSAPRLRRLHRGKAAAFSVVTPQLPLAAAPPSGGPTYFTHPNPLRSTFVLYHMR